MRAHSINPSAIFRTRLQMFRLAPVDDYHPSHFLGEHILDDDDKETGAETRDVIEGQGRR